MIVTILLREDQLPPLPDFPHRGKPSPLRKCPTFHFAQGITNSPQYPVPNRNLNAYISPPRSPDQSLSIGQTCTCLLSTCRAPIQVMAQSNYLQFLQDVIQHALCRSVIHRDFSKMICPNLKKMCAGSGKLSATLEKVVRRGRILPTSLLRTWRSCCRRIALRFSAMR